MTVGTSNNGTVERLKSNDRYEKYYDQFINEEDLDLEQSPSVDNEDLEEEQEE